MSNGSQSRSSSSFHFAAGLGSGILSACLLQPADLLKTRVQQSSSASLTVVFRAIARSQHPLRQLWRGTLPSALRTGFGSALYFSSLNALRQHVAQSNLLAASGNASYGYAKYSSSSLPRLSNTANLATGAFARATVGFIMMPITVIKVRYESSLFSYKSIWGASTSILKTEGIKGFFSGFGATATRDAPYAGLYVLFYEQSKRRLSSLQEVPLLSQRVAPENSGMRNSTSASINFVSGVLAAGLATAITNPFDAVKTRLQLMPGKYGNMVKAGKQMVMEDGFRSLFDGLALRMGRKALSSALAWTLYEELIRRAEPKWKEKTETVL
ncbi:solute carrier family 25 member 38 [Lasallia pustulata]|uniref:Mitochondrial glycine transporter n=1 Tax=Lasallia pustulata TaxID=136370 RepID=A0A1W5D3H5_9LECA|nr:solute carrier family 25 member 38 [Lasallia pustulata]